MCAGCSKDEREQAESEVRKGVGARADGSETWIVSVVKVQGRWSVTLDGPAIRALHCTAPPGYLEQAIREALAAKTGAAAAAAPPAAIPPRPRPPPLRAAAPAAAARPTARRRATPPPLDATPAGRATRRSRARAARAAPPAPAPASAAAPPASSSRRAPRRASAGAGSHACESCAQRFRVVFEAVPGEEQKMSPVACPHCWHLNRVPVGENAAADGDYRAEKA